MFYHINTCVTLREESASDKWMPVSWLVQELRSAGSGATFNLTGRKPHWGLPWRLPVTQLGPSDRDGADRSTCVGGITYTLGRASGITEPLAVPCTYYWRLGRKYWGRRMWCRNRRGRGAFRHLTVPSFESVCVCVGGGGASNTTGIFLSGGGQGGHCPPLNFDNPKRSRIWEAYGVVRLAAT